MMAYEPKKNGGPNSKFYESPESIAQLDVVRTWLLKNCKKVNCQLERTDIMYISANIVIFVLKIDNKIDILSS